VYTHPHRYASKLACEALRAGQFHHLGKIYILNIITKKIFLQTKKNIRGLKEQKINGG